MLVIMAAFRQTVAQWELSLSVYQTYLVTLSESNKTSAFVFSEAAQGTCVSNIPNHSEMFDRFEGKLSPLWYKITGGQVGTGCGTLNDGRSLYFNGLGKREARTVPLDTRNIRQVVDWNTYPEHSRLLLLCISCNTSAYGLLMQNMKLSSNCIIK